MGKGREGGLVQGEVCPRLVNIWVGMSGQKRLLFFSWAAVLEKAGFTSIIWVCYSRVFLLASFSRSIDIELAASRLTWRAWRA